MATLEIYLGCRGSIKTRGIPVLWGGLNPKGVGEVGQEKLLGGFGSSPALSTEGPGSCS